MEIDNFDNQVERGIAEYNGDITGSVFKINTPLHSMPSFEDILKNKPSKLHPISINIGKEFVAKMVEKISDSGSQNRSEEIPSFNLGEQILAGQRKASALKRKSPSSSNGALKADKPVQQEAVKSFASAAPASPQQRIIADIVTREILLLSSAR